MINYTISEFLGIFLIGLPLLIFMVVILPAGIRKIFDTIIEEEPTLDQKVFHHHYHYKAARD